MLEIYYFDSILCDLCYTTPNDTRFYIKRQGFDKNGNPKYHLYMSFENMLKIKNTKCRFGKVYDLYNEDKCRLVFTSYNLSQDIKYLFEICRIESNLQ